MTNRFFSPDLDKESGVTDQGWPVCLYLLIAMSILSYLSLPSLPSSPSAFTSSTTSSASSTFLASPTSLFWPFYIVVRRCDSCHVFCCSYIYCIFYLSCDIWYNLCRRKPLLQAQRLFLVPCPQLGHFLMDLKNFLRIMFKLCERHIVVFQKHDILPSQIFITLDEKSQFGSILLQKACACKLKYSI